MKARVAIIAVVVVLLAIVVALIWHGHHASLLYRDNSRDESDAWAANNAGYALVVRDNVGLGGTGTSSYVWHDGALSGAYRLNAAGVDSRGDIAGTDDHGRPLFGTNGDLVPLASPPGGKQIEISAVSGSGVVGGTYWPSAQRSRHGILWARGALQDIAPPPGYSIFEVADVTDSGETALTLEASVPAKKLMPAVYLNGAVRLLGMPSGATNGWSTGFVNQRLLVSVFKLGHSPSRESVAAWKSPYLGDPVIWPIPAGYVFVRVLPTGGAPVAWPLVLVGPDATTIYLDVAGRLSKLASTGRITSVTGINDKGLMTGIEYETEKPTVLQRWFPQLFQTWSVSERAVIYQVDLIDALKAAQAESRVKQ